MALATADLPQSFPGWDRKLRAPVPPPPAGSCDCQFHIYADPQLYPPKRDALYAEIAKAIEAQLTSAVPSAS